MRLDRRSVLRAGVAGPIAWWLSSCSSDPAADPSTGPSTDSSPEFTPESSPDSSTDSSPQFSAQMPAEEAPHEATWMCFPGRRDVWGPDLADVQSDIAALGRAIASFEPVRMLVRPDDVAFASDLVGSDVELIEAPVDDLWARDTLPLFVVSDTGELAAGRVRFNGWGGKQVHDGDATLAEFVAEILDVPLLDGGLVGEGGGVETDGAGTLLAARSSWANPNRNPGLDEDEIARRLTALLGGQRVLWVDGVAGQDITDGHIDTIARFTDPETIVHEYPSYVEPGDVWYDLAVRSEQQLAEFRTLDGDDYRMVRLDQPATTRRGDPEFLASYVNYYVCNGAVIVAEFGDAAADAIAAEQLAELYPEREVVQLDIDAVASGGGGVHCATQQQPAI